MAKLQTVSTPAPNTTPTKPLASDASINEAGSGPKAGRNADFIEASHHFSNTVHALCKQTHRVSAVLRLMQSCYSNTELAQVDMDDVAELTDMLVDIMPHHYYDVNDPLDAFDTATRMAMKDALNYGDKLNAILEAMTIAARGDSTPEELSEVAAKVLDIANADPAYEPDWQTFVDAVESRGYTVSTEEHKGVRMLPSVSTPEMVKLRRKQSRAVAKLVATVNQSTAASRKAPAGEGRRS